MSVWFAIIEERSPSASATQIERCLRRATPTHDSSIHNAVEWQLSHLVHIATATTVRTFQKLTLTIGFGTFVLITLATAITPTTALVAIAAIVYYKRSFSSYLSAIRLKRRP